MSYTDKEWLYEELYVKRRTARDIGDEFNVNYNTVNRYAKKFGIRELIEKESASQPFKNRDWMYQEVYVNKRTAGDIAKEFEVGKSSIQKLIKKLGISEIIKSEEDPKLYADKDWLTEMYCVRRMSSEEIADMFNVSRGAVQRNIKKFELSRRPALEEEVELLCNNCKTPFTRTLRSVLQRVRNNGTKLCCSKTCSATVKMTDPAYADNLQRAARRFQKSEEGKEMMRSAAIKSNIKQASNRGRTSIEQRLAEELERRDIRYVEQYKVGERFPSGFLPPDHNTILEADGRFWHSSAKALEKDKRKNSYITSLGYALYRFWDDEINEDVSSCVDKIFERSLNNG